ncbi:type II toxin-antitoxin system RelE family toxin [Streptococcus zalophi]|uniref:Addiction module toxin RelE n=1 Tax=Streptococcus zalophi TaxID=640031 RepID=A0A934UDZ6_9STRE|nr:addiction module toxin RelE [Streptococcus zalophi]MBJ8350193.1 addiction module toxin RelE [Streptococcus zalophi]
MKYNIHFNDLSIGDFKSLDNSQASFVRKAFLKLEQKGMMVGKHLSGDLSGCKKLKSKKTGLRIIFKLHPKDSHTILIIAIGKREDKEIYNVAARRLK